MSTYRILFIGSIVGSPGVFCVKSLLPKLKEEQNIDFVIANAEGVTGGYGLGKTHAVYLKKLGIDVLTSGECIYYKKDLVPFIGNVSFILRPANFYYENPGRSWGIYNIKDSRIAVLNLIGQYGFSRHYPANPFNMAPKLIDKIKQETDLVLVDFHALASAEKKTLFYMLDGTVSAVIGTHTRVLTADPEILPKGTAVITDCGRTGSFLSVGGLDPEIEIKKYLTQILEYSKVTWEDLRLQGVIVDIDSNGKAQQINVINISCREVPDSQLKKASD